MNYQLYRDAKDKAVHIHKRITSEDDPGAKEKTNSVELTPEEMTKIMERIKDVYKNQNE